MKNPFVQFALSLTLAIPVLGLTACREKRESAVVEHPGSAHVVVVEPRPVVTIEVHGDGHKGHFKFRK